MPAMFEIRFLPENRVARFFGSRGNYYEFPDGTHIDVQTTPAWCPQCADFVNAELIESLDEIDQQLADLRNPRSKLYQFLAKDYLCEFKDLGESFTREHSVERERRRQWRENRTSPPRCLLCGTTDIVILPFDEPAPNPAGPGTIELRCVGMCSTDFNEWFFTPDGQRIPRDTKPTHWHHPGLDNSPGAALRFVAQALKRNRTCRAT